MKRGERGCTNCGVLTSCLLCGGHVPDSQDFEFDVFEAVFVKIDAYSSPLYLLLVDEISPVLSATPPELYRTHQAKITAASQPCRKQLPSRV